MSGELIVRNGKKTLARVSEAEQRMDAALARLRGDVAPRTARIVPSSRDTTIREVEPLAARDVVDLPRYCAVHGLPYVARYITNSDGHYRHAQTIRVVEPVKDQYISNRTGRGEVPSADIAYEACPWCGAAGSGSISCGGCNAEVCYGRTTGTSFRCMDSCGNEGELRTTPRKYLGLRPGLAPRKGYDAS